MVVKLDDMFDVKFFKDLDYGYLFTTYIDPLIYMRIPDVCDPEEYGTDGFGMVTYNALSVETGGVVHFDDDEKIIYKRGHLEIEG